MISWINQVFLVLGSICNISGWYIENHSLQVLVNNSIFHRVLYCVLKMGFWWVIFLHFREQQKKLSALEMELAAARQEGFTSKRSTETNGTHSKKRPLVIIGVLTRFGRNHNRDAIRKAWMGTGIVSLVFVFACFSFLIQLDFVFLLFVFQSICLIYANITGLSVLQMC